MFVCLRDGKSDKELEAEHDQEENVVVGVEQNIRRATGGPEGRSKILDYLYFRNIVGNQQTLVNVFV